LASPEDAAAGQKKICFDYSHNNPLQLEEVPFNFFTDYLFGQNFILAKAELGFRNASYLQQFDALVIGNMIDASLDPGEIENIVDFVKEGGGLLLVCDQGGDFENHNNISELGQQFGITFNSDHIYDPEDHTGRQEYIRVKNLKVHAITQDIMSFVHSTGCSLSINSEVENEHLDVDAIAFASETARRKIYDPETDTWLDVPCPGEAILAVARYYQGHVVAIGNVSLFSSLGIDYGLKMEENLALVCNILNWVLSPEPNIPPDENLQHLRDNQRKPQPAPPPSNPNVVLMEDTEGITTLPTGGGELRTALEQFGWEEIDEVGEIMLKMHDLEIENSRLQGENATLRQALDDANSNGSSPRQQVAQVPEFPPEESSPSPEILERVERLTQQLAEVTEDRDEQVIAKSEFEDRVQSLEQQLAHASGEHETLTAVISEMEGKVRDLENKASLLQADFEKSQTRLFELEADLVVAQVCQPDEDFEEQLHLNDQQITRMTAQIADLQAKNAELQDQLEQSYTENANLGETGELSKASESSGEHMQNQVKESTSHELEQELHQTIENLNLSNFQIADLEEMVSHLREELVQSQENVQAKEELINSLQDEWKTKEDLLLQQANELHQPSVDSNKETEFAEEVKNLRKELSQTQEDMQAKEEIIQTLQEMLQDQKLEFDQQGLELKQTISSENIVRVSAETSNQDQNSELQQYREQNAQLTQNLQDLARKCMILEDQNAALQERINAIQAEFKSKLANVEILLAQKEAQIAELQPGFTPVAPDGGSEKSPEPPYQFGSDRQIRAVTEELERWRAKFQESEVVHVKLYNEIQKLQEEKQILEDRLKGTPLSESFDSKKKGKLFKRGEDKQKK